MEIQYHFTRFPVSAQVLIADLAKFHFFFSIVFAVLVFGWNRIQHALTAIAHQDTTQTNHIGATRQCDLIIVAHPHG